MSDLNIHRILTYFIAFVWFVNGLICKVLNLVPRHNQIVSRILGDDYSNQLTVLIGTLEIAMSIWILTKYKSKINSIIQISIIFLMNVIEFILAPDLLLFGKLNIIFALLFIGLIYYNDFVLNNRINLQTVK